MASGISSSISNGVSTKKSSEEDIVTANGQVGGHFSFLIQIMCTKANVKTVKFSVFTIPVSEILVSTFAGLDHYKSLRGLRAPPHSKH